MGPRTASLTLFALATLLMVPRGAQAGGFEYPGAGARSLGRGGAYHARVDDPLALVYNPANLGALPDPQASVDLNWPLYEYCQTRYWTDAAGAERVGPKVCNEAVAVPVPNVGFGMRLHDRIGLGVGVITPASVNKVKFPNDEGRVFDPDQNAFVPAPTRYSLVQRDVLLTFPSVGLGVNIAPWLKLGFTFGWGIAHVNFTTTAHATGGNDPDSDIVTGLDGKDSFVPRFVASLASEPVRGLDLALTFMWTDDIKATGDLQMAFGPGIEETLMALLPDVEIPESLVVEDARIRSPQPWQIAFGIRYGHERPGVRDRDDAWSFGDPVNDKMATEVWDIELDVVYERTSDVDAIRVNTPPGNFIYDMSPGVDGSGVEVPVPSEIALPHEWKDQISVRLGGDYNVIPNTLALRSGLSFETAGVPDAYTQLDFRPAQRFGLHLGLTVRVAERFDFSLAYAHLFEKDVENTRAGGESDGKLEQTVGGASLNGTEITLPPGPGIVNDGKFESSYDVLALGLNYHF